MVSIPQTSRSWAGNALVEGTGMGPPGHANQVHLVVAGFEWYVLIASKAVNDGNYTYTSLYSQGMLPIHGYRMTDSSKTSVRDCEIVHGLNLQPAVWISKQLH